MTVSPCAIVERFDVVGDVLGCHISVSVNMLLDPFFLETAEERFSHGIVPAIAPAAHTGFEMMGLAEPSPGVAAVLRALIRVNHCPSRSSAPHGHKNGIKHELSMDRRASRPANDSARGKIQHHAP